MIKKSVQQDALASVEEEKATFNDPDNESEPQLNSQQQPEVIQNDAISKLHLLTSPSMVEIIDKSVEDYLRSTFNGQNPPYIVDALSLWETKLKDIWSRTYDFEDCQNHKMDLPDDLATFKISALDVFRLATQDLVNGQMKKVEVNSRYFFFQTLKTTFTCCKHTQEILLAHQAAALLTGNTLKNEFLSPRLTDTANQEVLLSWYLLQQNLNFDSMLHLINLLRQRQCHDCSSQFIITMPLTVECDKKLAIEQEITKLITESANFYKQRMHDPRGIIIPIFVTNKTSKDYPSESWWSLATCLSSNNSNKKPYICSSHYTIVETRSPLGNSLLYKLNSLHHQLSALCSTWLNARGNRTLRVQVDELNSGICCVALIELITLHDDDFLGLEHIQDNLDSIREVVAENIFQGAYYLRTCNNSKHLLVDREIYFNNQNCFVESVENCVQKPANMNLLGAGGQLGRSSEQVNENKQAQYNKSKNKRLANTSTKKARSRKSNYEVEQEFIAQSMHHENNQVHQEEGSQQQPDLYYHHWSGVYLPYPPPKEFKRQQLSESQINLNKQIMNQPHIPISNQNSNIAPFQQQMTTSSQLQQQHQNRKSNQDEPIPQESDGEHSELYSIREIEDLLLDYMNKKKSSSQKTGFGQLGTDKKINKAIGKESQQNQKQKSVVHFNEEQQDEEESSTCQNQESRAFNSMSQLPVQKRESEDEGVAILENKPSPFKKTDLKYTTQIGSQNCDKLIQGQQNQSSSSPNNTNSQTISLAEREQFEKYKKFMMRCEEKAKLAKITSPLGSSVNQQIADYGQKSNQMNSNNTQSTNQVMQTKPSNLSMSGFSSSMQRYQPINSQGLSFVQSQLSPSTQKHQLMNQFPQNQNMDGFQAFANQKWLGKSKDDVNAKNKKKGDQQYFQK